MLILLLLRFESFVLGPGEKKVEMEADTRKYLTSQSFWS